MKAIRKLIKYFVVNDCFNGFCYYFRNKGTKMNVFDKINYMIEAVNRHNEKVYQENPPPTQPKKQFPYTKKANIEDFEKKNAAYEYENKRHSSKLEGLIKKFPHVLLVTEQACLSEYLSNLIAKKIGVNAFTTSAHFIFSHQINKDSELADAISNLTGRYILQIDRVEELKESLLATFLHKYSVVASTITYTNIGTALKEMFFLVIHGDEILKLSEHYVRYLLENEKFDFTTDAISSIINASEKRSLSLKAVTRNVIDFLRMKDPDKTALHLEDVSYYLDFCGVPEKTSAQILRSRRISDEVKLEVWRRDEGKCVICSSQEWLEYDHVIPFSKGGSNTARNIQLLCESCNREKSAEI